MANKLELTWYGKDEPIRVEPRLLIENTALSNTAADPDTQNMLIHGDNLLALKALESKFAGQVKCIYIDPPFNTGQAFENYDDNLEMSIWLDLMRSRLQIIHTLLKDDGTLFVHIDDQNLPYLTLLLDEIFGKQNRLYLITFKQGAATGHKAINPGCVTTTNFILRHWRFSAPMPFTAARSAGCHGGLQDFEIDADLGAPNMLWRYSLEKCPFAPCFQGFWAAQTYENGGIFNGQQRKKSSLRVAVRRSVAGSGRILQAG